MIRTEISLVAVLLCGFGLWICGAFLVSLVRARAWSRSVRRSAAVMPQIKLTLVDYLAGADNQTKLRELSDISRADVGAAIASLEETVAGGARDRLCELTLELWLVQEWCEQTHSRDAMVRRTAFSRLAFVSAYEPCRRLCADILRKALQDPDDEVKLYAGRALSRSGGIRDIERVFEQAIASDLLVQVLLTEELRRHVVALCEHAIPKELEDGDPERIRRMLHMLSSWERALPMPRMGRLLNSPQREVRLEALRLAPLVVDAPEVSKSILDALNDPDPEIVAAAARATARCNMETAVPLLARCLRMGSAPVARAAAEALAEMPRGVDTLRELCSSTNELTSLAAHEALARAGVPQ